MSMLHAPAGPGADAGSGSSSAAPGIDAQWLHDMRDALNGVSLLAAVAGSMLERNSPDRARELLQELEHACDRCRVLMARLRVD